MTILELKDLSVVYETGKKTVRAVNNISLNFEDNLSYGLVGESGSGKSTMAMAILNLLDPDKAEVYGQINYKGRNILDLEEEELRKLRWKDISVVFQGAMNSLSPVHKIGNQMVDIYRVHDRKASDGEVRERIIDLFKLVNLPERVFSAYPHELSGGMMQRVSIALSLLFNPKILILDEATTALDVITERQILEEIKEIEEAFKLTRIMITHDVSVVASSCQKVIVMYGGFILEEGYVDEVFRKAKHPYTKGLLESYPSLRGEKKELVAIGGSLADLSKESQACVFYSRCTRRKEICKRERPELLGREWKVACHFPEGGRDD